MLKKLFKTDSTKTITFFYFFLLIYTIAALIWWGVLLHKQNLEIEALKIENLELQKEKSRSNLIYQQEEEAIMAQSRLRNLQYLGEGGAFLLIILLSAGFVFQSMRRQIRFSRQQQNFMMAVTHELKSPIAVLRLNLETILKRKLPNETQKNLLTKTLAETNRLNQLSNNMLLASQFESRQYHMVKEPVNLSGLVEKIIADSSERIKHHNISSDVHSNIMVEGDTLMLQIVCNNLIENARKYAPMESNIHISLYAKNQEAILQVCDEGEGIENEEKKKIFNRFYRIGNENTRKSKGTGLGLFLTKKIVFQHGGQIKVMDNHPKGSIFEVVLPQTGKKNNNISNR